MADNVQLGVSVVDNTKQGLSSAFNNTTKMTAKMAKKLVLEVNVAFPNIASKTKDLQSQLSRAFRAMGNIDFVGNRLGKKGNVLSMLGFDGKELRKDMSLDAVKQHLARLKEIQAKLNDNTLVSGSKGEAFKKEQKNISNAIKALEQYKNTLDLIFRTNSKYNTKLTSATAAKQVGAAERAAKVEDNLLRRRYQYELSQLSKKESILERIANLEAKRNNSSTITSKTARLNEERAAIGGMITLYEQLIAIDKRHGADTSANQAKLNALRQEYTQIKNNITATQKAEAAERARLRASSALLGIAKNINQYNNQRNEIKNLGGIQRLNQEYSVVNKTRKAWEAYRKKLIEAGRNANFAAIDRRIAALRQEEKQLYANRIAAQERNRVNRVNAQLEKQYKSQGQLLGRLGSLASRYFSIYTIARFADNVAKTTGFFQQQQVALEGIIGSASKATTIFNDIQSFALQSPFQTKELVDFTKKLSAFGIEPDKLFPTVKELADISTGLGVDMGRIILAYGQVKSASVLRGQELRQFTEAGIPMVQALADKFTKMNGELVTTADIFEMISKRQVSFEVVADVLSDMTKEGGRFYKMQENVTNTLYGQIQKLKDLWTLALKDIGNSAGGFLNGIVSLLQKVVSNAKMVSTALAAAFVGNWIGKNIYGIVRIMTHLKAYIRLLRVAATLNKSAFIGFGLGAALAVGVGAFVKIKDELTKVKRKMQEISDSFTKETNKMIDGVNALIKRMRSAAAGSKEWNDALETLKNNYGEYLDINDAVLQKVIQGIDLNKEEKKSFDDLSESIAAAIKLKKEYEELTAKKNEAENLMSAEFAGMFKRNSKMLVSQIGEKGNLNDFFGTNYDKAISPQISSRIEAIFKSALDAFTSYGKTSFEDFKTIFKTMLNNEFIGSDLKGNSAETIIDSYLKTTFSSISGSSVFAEYLKIVGKLSGEGSSLFDSMVRINRLFEDNKFSPMENTPLGIHKERENFYRDIFGEGLTSELNAIVNQEGTQKSKDALLELIAIVADTEKGTYDVYVAFDNLLNAVADPERRRVIADAANLYKKHTDALTDDEMALAKNLESITEFSNSVVQLDRKNNFKTQEYFEKWDPSVRGDKTIEQTREEISTEYQSLKKELDTYLSKDAEIFANEIKVIQEKMKVLEKIAGSSFYNVDLTDNKKGGRNKYERIRITNFFDDLLSLITKAEDEMKKIVGMTGYTESLGDFVNSLSPDNFLKAFFEEGGNPFKDILAKMTEYGITDFLPNFDEDTLKNIFRNAGWEEGKEMSIPDFKAMYEQVIKVVGDQVLEGLKTRRDQYAIGSSERNSLDSAIKSLQEQQAKSIKTMTTRWGGDEIEKKINLAIKELTNIGSKLDDIKSQRSMYERISKSSNPLIAKNALPDVSGYFSDSRYTSAALREMLRSEGGAGIASTLVGERLKSLLNGSSLNIDNLSALFEIIRDLEEQAGEKEITLADGTKTANSDQFKETTSKIVDIINKLVESILKEYDKLAQYKTGDLKISDEILQAAEDFKNALKEIEETEKDPKRAASMKLSATQQYYDKVLTSLGGSEIPDWIKTMFGKEGAFGGISDSGRFMKNISGGSSLLDMIIQGKASNINKLYQAGKFGEVGSDKAMQGAADELANAASSAAGSIAMVDAIIKAVYQAINAVVELGKGVLKVDAKVNNKLNLRKGANGKLYDKDGNINIDDNYYKKQERREIASQALDIIGNFNNHIMGGWEKLKSGDIFGAITETAMSIADLIGDIIGVGDTKLRQKQDELIRSNERLANVMNSLEHALSLSVGNEKYDIYKEKASKLREQQLLYEQLLALENLKKNGDDEKAQDYASQAKEAGDQLDTLLNDFKTEVLGTADELANTLTDALVGAFREGTNAARAWRDAVRGYIGDILKQELLTKIISPRIEGIMDSFFGSDVLTSDQVKELFGDENKVLDFVDALNSEGTNLIDIFNNLPQALQDLIAFNGSTSALSGGISGITEDTARTLEGIGNSMLMQMVLTNRELSTISQSGFAQVQVSWFNDMLQQARATRTASEQIKQILDETRNGVRPLKVEVM